MALPQINGQVPRGRSNPIARQGLTLAKSRATPWRNHIVSQGAVWLLVCLIFLGVYKLWNQKWAYWTFFILSIFFFFGALGLYEGLYNHVLKNILYYGELPENLLLQLYPPPKYELPNDFIFEITGMLTFVIGALSGYVLIQYSRLFIIKKYAKHNFHIFWLFFRPLLLMVRK